MIRKLVFNTIVVAAFVTGCGPDPISGLLTQTKEPLTENWEKDLRFEASRVPITILGTIRRGGETLLADEIVKIVRDQFELSTSETPYAAADVRVVYDESENPAYLVVYLMHRQVYRLEVVKVDLDQYQVVAVQRNYKQQEHELAQGVNYSSRATCPDSEGRVEIVFAAYTPENFPTAIQGVKDAANIASNLGMVTKTLLNSEATVSNYKNWLACKHLKGLGNISHGSPTGIYLKGGELSSNYFNSVAGKKLEPKIIYFNSCQVHRNPLQPAVIKAGASRFIGGIENLMVGPSEEVFKCFWQEAIQSEGENVKQMVKTCENKKYPYSGHHGISGSGPMPWNTGMLGSNCSSNERCDSGFCVDGVCCNSACNQACHACNTTNKVGTCSPMADNTACPDSDRCNGDETCQGGLCVPGEAPVCQDNANPCTTSACDATKGCVQDPVANNTPCPNGDICDGQETCQHGVCERGEALLCEDDENECTRQYCDANLGCQVENVADNTPCGGQVCGNATCQGGSCMPSDPAFCDDGKPCTKNTCHPSRGCIAENLPDETSCGACMVCATGACIDEENCTIEGTSLFLQSLGCQTLGAMGSPDATLALFLLLVLLGSARRTRSGG